MKIEQSSTKRSKPRNQNWTGFLKKETADNKFKKGKKT
jgi:hypothetical protein